MATKPLATSGLLAILLSYLPAEDLSVCREGAELWVGQQVQARLHEGEIVHVTARRGEWIGVTVTRAGGKKISGWVRASDARNVVVTKPVRVVTVPRDYMFLVYYNGTDPALRGTALHSIWTKTGLGEFLLQSVKKTDLQDVCGVRHLQPLYGITPDLLRGLLAAEWLAVFYDYDRETHVPNVLFAANAGSSPSLRKEFLTYFETMSRLCSVTRKKVMGVETVSMTDGDGALEFALWENWLLVALGRDVMANALRNRKSMRPVNPMTGKPFDPSTSPVLAVSAAPKLFHETAAAGPDAAVAKMAKEAIGELDWCGLIVRPSQKGFRTSLILKPSPERVGELRELRGPAVSEEALKLIPRNSPMFAVFGHKPEEALDAALEASQKAGGDAHAKVKAGIEQLERVVGSDVREEVLGKIGSQPILAVLPGSVGVVPNVVVSVPITQSGDFEEAVGSLIEEANAELAKKPGPFFKRTPFQVHRTTVEFRNRKLGVIHFTGFPVPVAPSYVLEGDRLILAAFPQVLKDYLVFLDDGGPSILQNADFRRVRSMLPRDLQLLCYTELKTSARNIYGSLPMIFAALNGLPGSEGSFDVGKLPEWGAIEKHLSGALIGAYILDDCQVFETYSPIVVPLPGGESAFSGLGIATSLTGILGPSLARYFSRDDIVESSLRRLAAGALEHVDKFGDGEWYPKSLEDVYTSKIVTDKELFISPDDHEPAQFKKGLRSSYQSAFDISPVALPDSVPNDLLMIWERKADEDGDRRVISFEHKCDKLDQEEFEEHMRRLDSYIKKRVASGPLD